jgi:hypothetical protein
MAGASEFARCWRYRVSGMLELQGASRMHSDRAEVYITADDSRYGRQRRILYVSCHRSPALPVQPQRRRRSRGESLLAPSASLYVHTLIPGR